ncbi:MAG: hypothetical protein WCJ71_04840, partial [Candidatus Omnitrophota bacterium]
SGGVGGEGQDILFSPIPIRLFLSEIYFLMVDKTGPISALLRLIGIGTAPDFSLLFLNGSQGSPNLSIASIDRNWDCFS